MGLVQQLGLDRLSLDDRLALADELVVGATAEVVAAGLTGPQRAELDRRLAAYRADPGATTAWEELDAVLSARIDE